MDTVQTERRIRLAEAAQRYYVEGWSQDEVAAHLDTSRSNVSRLLEAARREQVVRFVIDHPLRRHAHLEQLLQERYPAIDVTVVEETDQDLALVGREAGRWLSTLQVDRIAIGWGRSVQAAIDHVAVEQARNIEVVQIGGDLTMAPAASGHELVRRLATALGGRHRFLHAPALVADPRAAAALKLDPRIAHELGLARTADAALIGIGVPGQGFAERAVADAYSGPMTPTAIVAARLVDEIGAELEGPLRDRVIAISLDDLKAIPQVTAVAAGTEKGVAIAAALRGSLIDRLICDQPAAAAALAAQEVDHATT